MGTHGRTGLGRFLTGSVAEEVLRKSVCPAMVVKTPLREEPEAEAEQTASVGEPVDVRPLGRAIATARTRALLRTSSLEVVRMIVREGQEIARHSSKSEVVVHCLEGRVACSALSKTQTLEAGSLLCLPAGETYTLKGLEDASVLLTQPVATH
jgi:quercetin dioxygenase-like cupin family protein